MTRWGRQGALMCVVIWTLGGCGDAVIERADGEGGLSQGEEVSTAQGLRTCASGETVRGIDVSTFQGRVDWDRVARTDVRFAIARISDGTIVRDDQFARNWSEIQRVGLIRGAYQFFRPARSPEAQAQIVIDAVGRLGDGDLPVVLDIETRDGISPAVITQRMKIWLDRVEAGTGKRPLIYTAGFFWNDLGRSLTAQFADYDLWVANYQAACPFMPDNTWTSWKLWQFTDREPIAGIVGGVDANLFNGSLAELRRYASAAAPRDEQAIEVYWARQADGSYELRALAPAGVDHVTYSVDGYDIGASSRSEGDNFPARYTFSQTRDERLLEVIGFDATGQRVASGVGLFAVTAGVGVYIKQMGPMLYEIGLERAPAGVASIAVTVDDRWTLTDLVSQQQRSPRRAVRHRFSDTGERRFTITTYNADGSLRGNLYRTLTLR